MPKKPTYKNSKIAFVLFTKTPELGQVKTRLALNIGNKLALDFHSAFIADSLENVSKLNNSLDNSLDYYLYLTKPWDLSTAPIPKILEKNLFTLKYQSKGDLGVRLQTAFQELFSLYKAVIIIGTDSPNIPLSYLEKAFIELNKYDLVIGSSVDGGYYLIGLNRDIENFSEIFTNINWSTETVFQETIKRIEVKNLTFYNLPIWYDIDTLDDLIKLKNSLLDPYNDSKNCFHTKKLLQTTVLP